MIAGGCSLGFEFVQHPDQRTGYLQWGDGENDPIDTEFTYADLGNVIGEMWLAWKAALALPEGK